MAGLDGEEVRIESASAETDMLVFYVMRGRTTIT